jgi:hypothetical protein
LRPLDQQVPLELSHSIQDTHGHLPGRARQVYSAERKAMHPDAGLRQGFDRGSHVHRVAAQTVELGDDPIRAIGDRPRRR